MQSMPRPADYGLLSFILYHLVEVQNDRYTKLAKVPEISLKCLVLVCTCSPHKDKGITRDGRRLRIEARAQTGYWLLGPI